METNAIYNITDAVPDILQIDPGTQDPMEQELLRTGRWAFAPIYRLNAHGAMTMWQVGFDTRRNEIMMVHGVVDGAMQIARNEVELNQSGKSVHEQALQDTRQRYKIKYRNDGYRPAGVPISGTDEPMLATKLEPTTRLTFPVLVQPKLDGMRCVVRMMPDGRLQYRSRGNVVLPHLNAQFDAEVAPIFANIPYNVELDGELYIHGTSFQAITSIIKNERKLHARLGELLFCIFTFNVAEPIPAENRAIILNNAYDAAIAEGIVMTRVIVVESRIVDSLDDIMTMHAYYVENGYEGVMIYKMANGATSGAALEESLYRQGRSSNLLKYKLMLDEEGIVEDIVDGSGKDKGLAIFRVRDPRGNLVDMRPGGDDAKSRKIANALRKEWFDNRAQLIKKVVTYSYQELTDKGKPRFPIVRGFRDDVRPT